MKFSKTIVAAEIKDDGGFFWVPAGWYVVKLEDAEIKENSKKTGELLALNMRILNGDFEGVLIKDNANIAHESEKTQEIGLRKLKRVMEALGLATIDDTRQIEGKPFLARIGCKAGSPYKNKVRWENELENARSTDGEIPAPPTRADADAMGEPPQPTAIERSWDNSTAPKNDAGGGNDWQSSGGSGRKW